jgi:hypothetical protein
MIEPTYLGTVSTRHGGLRVFAAPTSLRLVCDGVTIDVDANPDNLHDLQRLVQAGRAHVERLRERLVEEQAARALTGAA